MNEFIPAVPTIESFLQSLRLVRPVGDALDSFQVKFEPARDLDNSVAETAPLTVWFSQEPGITLIAVRRKIGTVLAGLGHPSDERICDLLLAALAIVQRRCKGTSTHLLNEMLSHIVSADLSQYFAFNISGLANFQFQAGGFQVGPLNMEKVAYWATKAGSDYTQRYTNRLKGLPLSISRLSKVKVMAWNRYSELTGPYRFFESEQSVLLCLVTEYFHLVAQSHFDKFFEDLRQVQLMPMALGSGWVNVDGLLRLVDAERIAIYENIQGQSKGWVSPITIAIHINLGGADSGVPFVIKSLEDQFGKIGNGRVDAVIQTYCRFLAEAAHLKAEGRISDAILYHVIALELLLNEKNSSTSSVTKRSAALTFTVLGKPYREVLEISERIYDARSKYVHEGRTPDPKLLDEVEMISREIAFVLFRLRQTDANNDEGFRDQWARRLDVLVAHLGADDPVSPSDLHRVGAADVGDFCFADLYRGLSGPVKPE